MILSKNKKQKVTHCKKTTIGNGRGSKPKRGCKAYRGQGKR